MTYKIFWGHSGSYGKEWRSALEASRFVADLWGVIEAGSPAKAASQAIAEMAKQGRLDPDDYDWHEGPDNCVHVVYCVAE